jgi:hypothetical protein
MDAKQPDDVLEQAQAAIGAAEHALTLAKTALIEAERRSGLDRRRRPRLTPDRRRVVGEIVDLAALPPDTELRPAQLAVYWKPCHTNSVLYWIRKGWLPSETRRAGYVVRAHDALVFQARLYAGSHIDPTIAPQRTT